MGGLTPVIETDENLSDKKHKSSNFEGTVDGVIPCRLAAVQWLLPVTVKHTTSSEQKVVTFFQLRLLPPPIIIGATTRLFVVSSRRRTRDPNPRSSHPRARLLILVPD